MRWLSRFFPRPDAASALQALARVTAPGETKNIVEAGLVSGVQVQRGDVRLVLTLPASQRALGQALEEECTQRLRAVPGMRRVYLVVTAHVDAPEAQKATSDPARARWNRTPLPHVARIVAVMSGKGGVGKSTTTVGIARALASLGQRVGVLDADIYGPSLPRLMGLTGAPAHAEGKMLPLFCEEIACLSMGLLYDPGVATVWRGPQLTKALQQMLRGARWGSEDAPLDWLLIDTPPGTGDVQLSLAQLVPLTAALLVTTPQMIASEEAARSLDMCRKLGVPVWGVIENMSGFIDPASGVTHRIFGEGGGLTLAEQADAPLLARVPLEMTLRAASDAGEAASGEVLRCYRDVASQLLSRASPSAMSSFAPL